MLDIEESAMYGNVDQMHEGIYTDSVIISNEDKLALEIEEAVKHGVSLKDALLKAIRKGSKVVSKGGLAYGKNKKVTGDITSENILQSKRKKNKVVRFDWIRSHQQTPSSSKRGETSTSKSGENTSDIRKGKGKLVVKVGDLISVSPTS